MAPKKNMEIPTNINELMENMSERFLNDVKTANEQFCVEMKKQGKQIEDNRKQIGAQKHVVEKMEADVEQLKKYSRQNFDSIQNLERKLHIRISGAEITEKVFDDEGKCKLQQKELYEYIDAFLKLTAESTNLQPLPEIKTVYVRKRTKLQVIIEMACVAAKQQILTSKFGKNLKESFGLYIQDDVSDVHDQKIREMHFLIKHVQEKGGLRKSCILTVKCHVQRVQLLDKNENININVLMICHKTYVRSQRNDNALNTITYLLLLQTREENADLDDEDSLDLTRNFLRMHI